MDQANTTAYQTDGVSPLYQRVSVALGAHDVSFSQRRAVRDAMGAIPEDERESVTWEQLPQEARAAIEACEAEPRSSWEDPLDVPDDTSYLN